MQTPGVAAEICDMEFVKKETDDMSDPEPSRIKQEDTEEQTGWCLFLIFHC